MPTKYSKYQTWKIFIIFKIFKTANTKVKKKKITKIDQEFSNPDQGEIEAKLATDSKGKISKP